MKIFLIIFTIIAAFSHLSAKANGIAFIVNANNPINSLTREQITNYYFKRSKQWADGTPVRFFDQSDTSPERAVFLQMYLKRTPRELEEFWIGQKLYTGFSAPSQVGSDKLMKSLVMRFPGAIGYVNENSDITEGIKKIVIDGTE